jgi:hypothetical protein
MKKNLLNFILTLTVMLFAVAGYSQGSTSSALNGRIADAGNESLIGATVIAVHIPTGTQYGTVTNLDGYYFFPTVRVGGPYKLTITYVGYDGVSIDNVFLKLGEKRNLDFDLNEASEKLAAVVISAQTDYVMNSGRTGASTNVSTETINTNPSINRSIEDFVRLTPQAASGVGNGGVSIAGSNSRYNNVTIDGAVSNDAFGLNADGLPGSSAGSEPISLDAIEQISILVAPYDVTKGAFTGGGINAITRSGSNNFDGSVYYYTRSENLAGKTIGEDRTEQAPFFNRQYGARVGGLIIKDKLFFFASAELQKAETPNQIGLVSQATLDTYGTNVPANVSFVSTETADQVKNHLINNYGYDPGTYGALVPQSQNTKLFGKIDWNINQNHQISLRHSYLHATDENISRSQSTLEFSNNGYLNDVTSNSTILELRSRLGDNMSNNLIVGYTSINRERNLDDYGPLFPHIDIRESGNLIRAGSQRSSVGNVLEQGIGQLTNNFTIFKNKHVITFGTHNELFHIYNSFVNRFNGHYEFSDLDDFLGNTFNDNSNNRFRVAYSLDYFNDRYQPADLNFLQSGFYVQDEWSVNDQLKVTAGLRLDIPIFIDKPTNNQLFKDEFNRNTQDVPSGQLLWSPRVGFNYDVKGDKSIQIRGGIGVFTGRVPFVWISNAYTNAGATISTLSVRGNSSSVGNVPFYPLDGNRTYEYYIANSIGASGVDDPAVKAEIERLQANSPTSQIDALDKDLKMPQTLRSNMAIDVKLPFGMTGTLEAIYSNAINAIQYQNLQLGATDGTISTEENRPTYSVNQINNNFFDVYLLTNTNKGYQYSFTGQLNKSWSKNFAASAAYTYGVSKDVNGGTHTTANSGWEFNPTPSSPNEPILSYSVWDLRHRLMANFNYIFEYSAYASTSIGVFLNAQSGSPFTYLVNGDLNGDGSSGNDQVYIPANQSEIIFGDNGTAYNQATQDELWSQLNAFIEKDDYLSGNRGKIAERNGARTPWTSTIDMRIMQEFKLKAGENNNKLQVSLDIENVTNLLNKGWGRIYNVQFNTYNLLNQEGFDATSGQPIYDYSDREEPWSINNGSSIWRMQLGLRYIFE